MEAERLPLKFGCEIPHGPEVAVALGEGQDVRAAQLAAQFDPVLEASRLAQFSGGKQFLVEPDQRAEVNRLREKVDAASLRLNRGSHELVAKSGRKVLAQVRRPAESDAFLDLETLPMKEDIRLLAGLELEAPTHGVIDFAVR